MGDPGTLKYNDKEFAEQLRKRGVTTIPEKKVKEIEERYRKKFSDNLYRLVPDQKAPIDQNLHSLINDNDKPSH